MSAAVLDRVIRMDKKIPPEFTTAENWIEIQVKVLNIVVSTSIIMISDS